MAIKITLPANMPIDLAKGALTLLAQDPNFEALCRIIDSNDVEQLRKRLEEDENIEDQEARKIRYRLKVLREIRGMPIKILNALENDGKPPVEENPTDPYE